MICKFSFLISCYYKDDKEFFHAALKSLFEQKYTNFEIILVLDGPIREDLENVISSLRAQYSEIIFIIYRLPVNVGLGPALSFGVKKCSGDYVVRHDADDISLPNRLEILSKFIKKNQGYDVIGTYISEFDKLCSRETFVRKVPLTHFDIQSFSFLRNPMNHVTVCIKRSVFESFSYQNYPLHEDYFFWLKLLNSGFKFINLPVVSVLVRVSHNSHVRSGLQYFICELKFIHSCYKHKYFQMHHCFLYLLCRMPFRFLPKSLVTKMYKKYLRK